MAPNARKAKRRQVIKKQTPDERGSEKPIYEKPLSLFLFGGRNDGDVGAILASAFELHCAVAEGVEGVVFTHTYVLAGVVDGAALANDDVAGDALLTTKYFNA